MAGSFDSTAVASGPGGSAMPSAPARHRDVAADFLKAAAIVGVVCIHAGLPFNDVLRFGVPVFVGLWAFYVEKALQRLPAERQVPYLARRFAELAVPYLVWTVFYIALLYRHLLAVTPWHTIVGGWFGGFGWAGQYFFIVLLQLMVLMPLLRRWATPRTTAAVIVLGVVFNVFAEYVLFNQRWVSAISDRLFIYWIPYVFMGIGLARGQFKGGRGVVLWAVALLLLLRAPWEATRFVGKSSYLMATVTVASLLLLWAAVGVDRRARDRARPTRLNAIATAIAFIGQNTFSIYVSNVLMLELFKHSGLLDAATARAGVGGVIVVIVLTTAGGLALGWLLQRLRLGILVGKPAR